MVAGIIDYFHQYDMLKRLEYMGKKLYQVEQEITVLAPSDYCKRFRRGLRRYFSPIPGRSTRPLTMSEEPRADRDSSAEREDARDRRVRTPGSQGLRREAGGLNPVERMLSAQFHTAETQASSTPASKSQTMTDM